MSLLGAPLLWLLGGITLAVTAGVYLAWTRVRGPRPVRLLTRIGLIICTQLAALSLAGAAINNYGYFYGSWSELGAGLWQLTGLSATAAATAGRTAPASTRDVGPGSGSGSGSGASAPKPSATGSAAAESVAVRAYPAYSGRAEWPTRGRIDSVTISGEATRLRSHAFVYLPPQYFQPRYARTVFPAAEVFTGYPGNDLNLVARMRYQDVLLRLITEHQARPMVLVMMRPSVTFPWDTECTNVPHGPPAETFFADDVPTRLVAHYRIRPSGWGVVGDSTGGYCAVKLAMLNPHRFRAAVSLSGYYFALRDSTTGDLWGGSTRLRNRNDLHWRLRHLPAPPVWVLVCTSPAERGPDGYREARSFGAAVKAPMRVAMLTVPNGGHNFRTWDTELPAVLGWLSYKLPAPAAAPTTHPTSARAGKPAGTASPGRSTR